MIIPPDNIFLIPCLALKKPHFVLFESRIATVIQIPGCPGHTTITSWLLGHGHGSSWVASICPSCKTSSCIKSDKVRIESKQYSSAAYQSFSIPKLDPEYLQIHNKHLQYVTPPHTLPWDPSFRNAPAVRVIWASRSRKGSGLHLTGHQVQIFRDWSGSIIDSRMAGFKFDIPWLSWWWDSLFISELIYISIVGWSWSYRGLDSTASVETYGSWPRRTKR